MKYTVHNQQGKEIGATSLPKTIFEVPMNSDLVYQVAVSQQANKRVVSAHAKTKGEVRGGGRKPWRQKGTGRARHGSIRSPLWRGGGVTFGPRNERVFKKKINKKMKQKALLMVLSSKVKDKTLIILDDLRIADSRTKEAAALLNALSAHQHSSLVVFSKPDQGLTRAFRNIPRIKTLLANGLNVLSLLSYKYLILPKESIKIIEETFTKENKEAKEIN